MPAMCLSHLARLGGLWHSHAVILVPVSNNQRHSDRVSRNPRHVCPVVVPCLRAVRRRAGSGCEGSAVTIGPLGNDVVGTSLASLSAIRADHDATELGRASSQEVDPESRRQHSGGVCV